MAIGLPAVLVGPEFHVIEGLENLHWTLDHRCALFLLKQRHGHSLVPTITVLHAPIARRLYGSASPTKWVPPHRRSRTSIPLWAIGYVQIVDQKSTRTIPACPISEETLSSIRAQETNAAAKPDNTHHGNPATERR